MSYLPMYMMWLILFIIMTTRKRNNRTIIANQIINNTRTENLKMFELAKRFIEKECIIYAFDGNQYNGVIKEVNEGAILIDKKGNTEAINLNFVVRIKEIQRGKK